MANILIVDDSPSDLRMLESILTANRHTAATLDDPTQAEARVVADAPDLVMLDVVMPGKNGYEVLRGLRRNPATKDVPVVLVSSKGAETDVSWGLRQGAKAYLIKPYTAEQVLAAVARVVG